MSTTLLEVKDLKTHFFLKRGVVKAVDGVNFTIEKEESLGIVGESGCGKTITAMSILRLEPKPAGKIVGGEIIFEGEDLIKKTEKEMEKVRGARISIIMQDPMTSLNPVYTIGNQLSETFTLHGYNKNKKEIQKKVIKVLEQVEIPEAATRTRNFPHQMSGGMRQRAAGAMAIACSPSLMIADEPTTSLDVTTQAQYLRLIRKLQRETGLAMLFITHDLGIVAKMCDKVCVMYMGKVIERGDVREIWDNPKHPYTIALMKSRPSLNTKVERLYAIKGSVPSLLDLPTGCNFHPRCERAIDQCRQEYPREEEFSNNHFVSCWRVNESNGK